MKIGEEKRERNKSSGEFSPMSCSFLGALSVIAGHFQGKAGRVKSSRFVYALPSGISTSRIYWRDRMGGGSGWLSG